MADEVQDNNSPAAQQALAADKSREQTNQGAADEAKKKVDVPGSVTTNNGENIAEILSKHQERTDNSAEAFKKFGVKNYQQFMDLVRSNPIIAARVADMYLASEGGHDVDETYGAAGLILDMQAPQELNVTGMVDNTGDVATKLHIEGESKAEPVVDETSGTNTGHTEGN